MAEIYKRNSDFDAISDDADNSNRKPLDSDTNNADKTSKVALDFYGSEASKSNKSNKSKQSRKRISTQSMKTVSQVWSKS